MVVSLEEGHFRLPLSLFQFRHIRYAVDVLYQDVAAADACIHAGPVVSINIGCALEAAGNLEQVVGNAGAGIGYDTADKVPHLISGEHAVIRGGNTVIGHVGIAGRQVTDGGGTQVKGHVDGGQTVVRHHIQEFIAADAAQQSGQANHKSGIYLFHIRPII